MIWETCNAPRSITPLAKLVPTYINCVKISSETGTQKSYFSENNQHLKTCVPEGQVGIGAGSWNFVSTGNFIAVVNGEYDCSLLFDIADSIKHSLKQKQ